ncbi:MAG: tetratricopeptide repeat protein [Ardenticatenales bacterium]|nr:tetratricopeptide repeat protein [Ardenticatenales bacterium]
MWGSIRKIFTNIYRGKRKRGARVAPRRDSYSQSEYETAIAAFSEAREVWRQVGDPRGEADALIGLGKTHQRMGNLADARWAYESSLHLYKEMKDEDGYEEVKEYLAALSALE